jgi:predicted nucleotidyltransferase
MAYCEIAYEKGWTKGTTALHGPLGIAYHPNEKASMIANCLENQFTSHDLCDENH